MVEMIVAFVVLLIIVVFNITKSGGWETPRPEGYYERQDSDEHIVPMYSLDHHNKKLYDEKDFHDYDHKDWDF